MTTNDALRVVQGYLAGHAVEWLSEQIEFQDVTRPALMRGRREVGAFLHLLFTEAFSDARVDDIRITPSGDRVCAEWVFRGRHTGSFAGERPTGREVAHPFACVYEVEAGEIRRARLYYDSAGLRTQLVAP
jgi:predicted ester cyclase